MSIMPINGLKMEGVLFAELPLKTRLAAELSPTYTMSLIPHGIGLFNSPNKTLLLIQNPNTPQPLWRTSPRGRNGLRVPSLTLRSVL